ncbi:MAG: hypothetical protein KKA19_01310, partial [Candidatus Margulisbacteria bacterium]|nr:hypothetical protein [Candidatus Margulisiibacteriota bacterium]
GKEIDLSTQQKINHFILLTLNSNIPQIKNIKNNPEKRHQYYLKDIYERYMRDEIYRKYKEREVELDFGIVDTPLEKNPFEANFFEEIGNNGSRKFRPIFNQAEIQAVKEQKRLWQYRWILVFTRALSIKHKQIEEIDDSDIRKYIINQLITKQELSTEERRKEKESAVQEYALKILYGEIKDRFLIPCEAGEKSIYGIKFDKNKKNDERIEEYIIYTLSEQGKIDKDTSREDIEKAIKEYAKAVRRGMPDKYLVPSENDISSLYGLQFALLESTLIDPDSNRKEKKYRRATFVIDHWRWFQVEKEREK